MIFPKTYTALSFPNLNDLTTTFAEMYLPNSVQARIAYEDLGAAKRYDTYGTRQAPAMPQSRQFSFVAKKANAEDLSAYLNTLMFEDVGKKGTLTFEGQDGFTYSCTARLERITHNVRHPNQEVCRVTLYVVEETPLTLNV